MEGNTKHGRWAPEEIRILEAGYKAGRKLEELAEELHRTQASVLAQIYRLGLGQKMERLEEWSRPKLDCMPDPFKPSK